MHSIKERGGYKDTQWAQRAVRSLRHFRSPEVGCRADVRLDFGTVNAFVDVTQTKRGSEAGGKG